MHVIRNILLSLVFLPLCVLLPPVSANGNSLSDEVPQWRYTVKPGDNLINIAERYFTNPGGWKRVQKINRVEEPRRILPGTVLRIPVDLLHETPGEARLAHVSGEVFWRMPNSTDWQLAEEGQKLVAGTMLKTSDEASATLLLADGSRVMIAPGSQMSLDTLSQYADGLMADTRLRVQHGQMEIMANPSRKQNQYIRVITPSAQAFVRGTNFRVRAEDKLTHEETVDGLVSVNAVGQKVNVAAGQGTYVKHGEAPSKPVELIRSPDVSMLASHFEMLPLRFILPTPSANMRAWYGQIAADHSFDKVILEKTVTGNVMSFADLPNGNYVLRLRAIDQYGLQGMDAVHPFTVFARPFAPGLNTPGHQAIIRNATPRFAWGKVVGVDRTRIQVSAQADFSSGLYDEVSGSDAWIPPAELPAGQLYWRAASIDHDAQQGPWSVPSAFVYKPAPGAIDLGHSAFKIEDGKIMLSLTFPPEGMRYEAALSTEHSLEPFLMQTVSENGEMSFDEPDVGSYYLGVRLVDRSDNTPGPYSVQQIEITPNPAWLLLLLVPLAAL